MKLPDIQRGFEKSVLLGEEGALSHQIIGDGIPARERLDIHRNNSLITLSEALAQNFPVTLRLVGQDFFHHMAKEYIRVHPPQCPVLSEYGEDFAAFIAQYDAAAGLGYLPDVARFEYLINRVSSDLDAAPVDPADFQDIDPEDTAHLKFIFSENMCLFESRWPIIEIWRANQAGRDGAVSLDGGPCHVAITRPYFEVVFLVLDRAAFNFLRRLEEGLTLGQAVEQSEGEIDISQILATIFTGRIIEKHSIEKDGK